MSGKEKKCEDENIILINESSLNPKDEKSQLTYTQAEAYKNLEEFLFDTLSDNKNLENEKYDKDCCVTKRDDFQRTHNTIFINGKRGSGKTQFLLSIENYITREQNNEPNSNSCQFYFFKPIDPTLLHDNENFLTIIVAMILNHIENTCKLNDLSKHEKTEFYTLLSDVSKAIDGTIHCKCVEGNSLETIAQDQSSLKLERYINKFFKLVLKIVKRKKLVILIDDIDMALNKGFEVLEVVRKYLSSSHVIPIVTGDIDLYSSIIEKDFFSTFPHEKDSLLKYSHVNSGFLTNLSKDYLIKVLPMHRRIKLKTFWDLAEDRCIIFNFNDKNIIFTRDINCKDIDFKKINCKEEDCIDKRFEKKEEKKEKIENLELFSEKIKKNLFTLSARSIIQIFKREIYEDFDNFLKSIESFEKIKKEYNYEILSRIEMLDIYKEKALEKLHTFDYKNAKKLLEKAKDINNKDYNLHAFLGLIYYELANEEDTKELSKELSTEITLYDDSQELYKKSINSYIEAYKLLTFNKINNDTEENEEDIKLILPRLADSYLELFELYLIKGYYFEYKQLSRDFKKYFNRKRNILKVFYMFEILEHIVSTKMEKETVIYKKMKKDWTRRFKTVYYEWGFEELYDWIDKEEINEDTQKFVRKQLEYFEENM